MTSAASSPSAGLKRSYQSEELVSGQTIPSDSSHPTSPPLTSASAASAFRNVSACNRCRIRKNRCDQRLPACSTCEKANVRCVGYDPITKREIPRSYVFFLETRLSYFELLLNKNNIPFDPAEVYNAESRELVDKVQSPGSAKTTWISTQSPNHDSPYATKTENWEKKQEEAEKLNKLVSNIGMVSVQGASDARYLGSTSGISFARVVLAAIKSSVSTNNSERAGPKPSKPLTNVAASGGSSMRDSFFGLQIKPSIKEASFPDRQLGERLIHLYFEHANCQIPVLHRVEFTDLFERAYSTEPSQRTARELYLLNIVFAIGAGIIWGSSDSTPDPVHQADYAVKRPKLANQQAQPEEYHASAIIHLGSFLSSSSSSDGMERSGGDLEELQAVLLLAAFALLRPVAPGLWYIVGVAMRLAVDLGLHYEDGSGLGDVAESNGVSNRSFGRAIDAREKGRREWTRDLRRRLWWCTYNFDRLVSTCVGRPFGITDIVVTTEFPSLLDDKYITRSGFLPPRSDHEPSYKRVAYHYFRLRLLQSEILQVLQYQQAQQARQNGVNRDNEFIHTKISSPFLSKFGSFREWRLDIDQRLYEWKESAPQQKQTGVNFSPQFLELNYWQAVTMLYRQSLTVPAPLAHEISPTEEFSSPTSTRVEDKEDEDRVFLKCAEAGQKTLKIYRQLHRQRIVNYTYLATHHLFMAGISFLYAVWHSPAVRKRLTLDDFDFTVLAATSVLGDLMEKCPPAEACRDAFERMSKATVQMCMSTPGFGLSSQHEMLQHPEPRHQRSSSSSNNATVPMVVDTHVKHEEYNSPFPKSKKLRRPPPQFDMDLRGLFPEDLEPSTRPSQSFPHSLMINQQRQQREQQQQHQQRHQASSPQQRQQSQSFSQQQIHSPASVASITPQMNNTSIYPSPQPLQRQSSDHQHLPHQQPPIYMQNTYNPDFMSIPGMDFLNSLTNPNYSNANQQRTPSPNNPTANLNQQDYGAFDFNLENSGLDLGFGIGAAGGLDFQHDWSDGSGGVDLFDGFFFGNGNASGGSGGVWKME